MPCRKENYIFLEQSVTVDSKEVDALVTKIGEALQLHNNNNNNGGGGGGHHLHHHLLQKNTVSVSVSCLHGLSSGTGIKPAAVISAGAPAQRQRGGGGGCCMRLRSRNSSSRASPYHIPGSNGDQDWDHMKPWNRKRRIGVLEDDDDAADDDPHRLLQDLILSGNLIKEAVRRLQFTGAAVDNVPPC